MGKAAATITFQKCPQFGQPINCNYILFTKLPWPGDSEGTFQSSSNAATCLPHAVEASHSVLSLKLLNVKQGSCEYLILIVFGLTRPGIEPDSTASVSNALFTRPPIG